MNLLSEIDINLTLSKIRRYLDSLNFSQEEKLIKLDVLALAQFDLELSEYLIDNPYDCIKCIETVLDEADRENPRPEILIYNLPQSEERQINRLRTKDLGKLIYFKGVVSGKSKVLPKLKNILYECPSCGNRLNILQTSQKIKEPSRCGCGRKGKFREIRKSFVDSLNLTLEELPESILPKEIPQRLLITIQGRLCEKEYNLYLGSRILVCGVLEEVPIQIKNGGCSTSFNLKLNCLHYSSLDDIEFCAEATEEEEELFKVIKSHKNPASLISKFVYPDIYGNKKAKELCVLQQFCGDLWSNKRDYLHILLYGDPGTAKTDLALRTAEINPISKVAAGTHSSGVGLTAAVEKDEITGSWVARGGLLARCNGGLAVIDEIEKMKDDDKNCLHMPMESGFFVLEKAGITAKVLTKTSILATANPKVSKGKSKVSIENLQLPPAIKDRFDFILTFKDYPDTKKDTMVSTFITNRATFEKENNTFGKKINTFDYKTNTFHISTIKKYIYLCKKKSPKLSSRLQSRINYWYSEIRKASKDLEYEEKIPTPRIVETILRLSRAISRSKLKDTITIHELKQAITYFDFAYGKDEDLKVISEEEVPDEPVFNIYQPCCYCEGFPSAEYEGKLYCKRHYPI